MVLCIQYNALPFLPIPKRDMAMPMHINWSYQILYYSPITQPNKLLYCNMKQAKKCNEAALSLLVCMEKTDCVKKKQKSLEECMKDPIESDPCLAVRNAYYNCKHSQLNMRTRIRGVRQY